MPQIERTVATIHHPHFGDVRCVMRPYSVNRQTIYQVDFINSNGQNLDEAFDYYIGEDEERLAERELWDFLKMEGYHYSVGGQQ